ncbi:ABC-type transport system ATP-binding protein (probable substrate copper) [Natronomonas pharaonis DSM 2160]|uniref:ABC-type transport system ATP-binding protein (Probable substrate copper) n=1 Tax=Natronomonas pharaonis (strain ATCC 35678 / DSM 2160 / CIP 103997 / JCM 8858 / NBRC 14720 / NCIMB 2260 / Gabara) TaxID=348780 RepID=A0A1U7EXX1_NATPD|nr:ABC transporter ATP-binding protein [Natronomonas pharaonis]CAI50050.1 ABC-type transport system ATP-binding protein (probable substrate copper) [Natronomonas pharaonis DSM 2160]
MSDGPETPTDGPVLTADGVSKSFGPVDVLSDISCVIPAEEVVAIIGPNGSGKTTLLRTLVGDLRPTAGEVTYHGPSVDRPIGYLPQRATFRSGFSCAETLSFYGSFVDGPDPATLLERVGLEGAADRNVEALSGGMRRLLGIAQAMVGDPPLVVLDEPASGLDPNMSASVFETAGEMAGGGTTVLLSSHDMSLVEAVADTVLVVSQGDVVASGAVAELYDRFEVSSLRGVIGSVVDDSDRVAVLGGDA